MSDLSPKSVSRFTPPCLNPNNQVTHAIPSQVSHLSSSIVPSGINKRARPEQSASSSSTTLSERTVTLTSPESSSSITAMDQMRKKLRPETSQTSCHDRQIGRAHV